MGKRDRIFCGKRLDKNSKRPMTISSFCIFISTRMFLSLVSDDNFVSPTCRWMYKRWLEVIRVKKMLLKK